MHYPSGSQGLTGSGKEYIELFNNNPCASVNIGCWMLGFADVDGFVNNRGCIQLPPNIILPPYSHYVIGTSSSSLDSNSIDFKINRNPSNLCSVGSFLLANGDGWVGLYDEAGIVVDAIYWTVNANEANKINNDGDLDDAPCIVSSVVGCNPANTLASPREINSIFPSRIFYCGQYVNGNTFSRVPDGGSWQRNVTASINDLSGGNCNGGSCLTSTFNLNATVSQPSCNSSNGGISFNPQPAGTYFYNWPFPTTGQTSSFNNLAAGSYSITITSASGCSKDTTIVLAASNGPTAVVVSESDPGCSQSNGSVTIVSVTGGTPQYQYNFNNLGFSNSQNYINLPAGTYPLTVKDANGCEFTAPDITLMSPNGPTAVTINKTDPGCSQSNGSVTIVSVTGGTPQYQYNFNNLGFSNSQNYTNLPAGTYPLIVKDANGCEFTAPDITLMSPNGPTAVTINKTDPGCSQSNGSVTIVSVIGGTPQYQYNFNNLGFSNSQNYINLPAGTYPLIVKDANGCEFTAPIITLNNPNSPSGIEYTSTPAKCDKTRGTITVTSVTGGVSPYTYSINGDPFTTDLFYDSLNVGLYPLIVKDANGCEFTEIINIASSSQLNATFTAGAQPGSNDSLTVGTTIGSYLWNYSSQNETLNASFINSSTAGSGISYNWIFNIGSVSDTTTTSLNDLYQNFQGSNTINVTLIVTNGDETCNDTASIVIDIKSIIQIPTIFSPNGDGINDVFFIKYRGYKDLTMTIFNRWGNKYYETTKPDEGWSANDAAEGTYFYIVTGKTSDDKSFESKGYFMLVR
jgi:gliding motility-associated-like protein